MSDGVYLAIQVWLILVLTFIDGATALVQHPEWFQ